MAYVDSLMSTETNGTTTYAYDTLGRLTGTTYPGSTPAECPASSRLDALGLR